MSQESSLLASCWPELPLQNAAALTRTTTGINDADADKIMWWKCDQSSRHCQFGMISCLQFYWIDIIIIININSDCTKVISVKNNLIEAEFIPARDVFSAGKTVKRSSHLVIMLATEHCKQIIFGNRKVRKDKFLFPKPNVLLITFGNERKLTIKLLVQLSISIFLLMDTTLSFVKKSTFYWGSQHGLRGKPSDDIKQYPRQTSPFTSTKDEECNPTLTFKNVTNLTWLLHHSTKLLTNQNCIDYVLWAMRELKEM